MDDNKRNFYDRFKDSVIAYVFHDPNAQAQTAFDRARKANDVDEKTFQLFKESAEAGHPFACFSVGLCYERGEGGVEKDYEKAYDWYRKAATSGDVNAWVALAKMFDKGLYVDKDPKEAAMWLERAAAKDHTLALVGMGQKYSTGDGVEKDHKRALEMFEKAHEKDQKLGSYVLGEAIGDGIGCEKNYEKSYELFVEAHENGFVPATFNVGMMKEMGLGCEKDEKAGFELIKQAADEDFPDAMYRTAFHYWDGTAPTGKDEKLAFQYYKKAADQDFAPACVETGICYENGAGVEKNPEEAFNYYAKGAKLGHHAAFVCLAVCYVAGIGCEPNREKARGLLEVAVKLGNSRAYHLLARMLMEEDPYDERAINLEMVAANNGFARSALFLGGYFLYHTELDPDKTRAKYYFRRAYQEGNLDAAFELADMMDTEENRDNAEIQKEIRELYKESADKGNHPLAAYRYAIILRNEEGNPVDQSENAYSAIHYMLIAAHGSVPEAAEEIAERMFWGNKVPVNLRRACGFYNYSGDELGKDELTARGAFARVLAECRAQYKRIGLRDKRGKQISLFEEGEEIPEQEKVQESFDKLTELAEAGNEIAGIFLPLAKVLMSGSDLSSKEDQERVKYVMDLPEERTNNYVKGILIAYLYPERTQEAIEILQKANNDLSADNVNCVLGNLYYTLAYSGHKARKLDVLVTTANTTPKGENVIVFPDKQAKLKQEMSRRNLAKMVKKTRKSKKDFLETAKEYYQHGYVSHEIENNEMFTRCYKRILAPNFLKAFIGWSICMIVLLPFLYVCTSYDTLPKLSDVNMESLRNYVIKGYLISVAILLGILAIVYVAALFKRRKAHKKMSKKTKT